MKRFAFAWSPLFAAVFALLACGPSLPVLTRAEPSPTTRPTRTPRPTPAATATDTVAPTNTATAAATATAVPATATSAPPTNTAAAKPPTNTPRPPTNTPPPAPPTNTRAPQATAPPALDFTGTYVDAPYAHTCKEPNPFIALRVVDRAGNPLPGYYVHVGKDGNQGWWSLPSTSIFKQTDTPYAHNADFLVAYSIKYYVTVFRQPQDTFDISGAISNEVTVYFPPRDDDNCPNGPTTGIRVAPITFVYNR